MNAVKVSTVIVLFLLTAGFAEARTVRVTEMTDSQWAEFYKGKMSDTVVEFRQGDELPVSVSAEGDLLQTTQSGVTYIGVKRNFWVKFRDSIVLLSLDGTHYRKIQDALSGSLSIGAGPNGGGVANAISVALKANVK